MCYCLVQVWQSTSVDASAMLEKLCSCCQASQDTRVHRGTVHAVAAAVKSKLASGKNPSSFVSYPVLRVIGHPTSACACVTFCAAEFALNLCMLSQGHAFSLLLHGLPVVVYSRSKPAANPGVASV